MRRTLTIGSKKFEIMPAAEVRPADTVKAFHDNDAALSFLRLAMTDPSNKTVLRAVATDSGTKMVSHLNDQLVASELATKVFNGRIKITETPPPKPLVVAKPKPPPVPVKPHGPPPKPPPPKPPPSIPKVRIVELVEVINKGKGYETVTRAAQDGVYRQYINLGKEIEGRKDPHPEYGPYFTVRAKIEWTDKKKKDPFTGWKVKFIAELEKGDKRPANLDTEARKWGFDSEGGHDKIDQVVGDDGSTGAVTFYVSQYGGDKFRLKAQAIDPDAQKSVGEKSIATPYQVWRKFWYQLTHDANLAIADPALAKTAYKNVFAEMVAADEATFTKAQVKKPDQTYYPEWMVKMNGGDTEVAIIGEHNKEEFYKKFKKEESKPVKAHIVVCFGQWDPVPVSSKITIKTRNNPSGPIKMKLKGGSPGIVKPALKGNLVKQGSWKYLAPKGQPGYGKHGKLTDKDILIAKTRTALNYVKVKVPDDTLDLTTYKVEINIELYYGASFCGESVGYQILCVSGPDAEFSPTLTHEIGHGFHQTPRDKEQPAPLPPHPKQYSDEHGGTGSHCSTGAALVVDADYPAKLYEDGTCVLFHCDNNVCSKIYCDACDPYVKTQDMTQLIAPPTKHWFRRFVDWLKGE
jgi:hypothetical protein